jgi:hypothetical protein
LSSADNSVVSDDLVVADDSVASVDLVVADNPVVAESGDVAAKRGRPSAASETVPDLMKERRVGDMIGTSSKLEGISQFGGRGKPAVRRRDRG